MKLEKVVGFLAFTESDIVRNVQIAVELLTNENLIYLYWLI